MSLRPTKLHPLLRSFAALTLLAWIGAQVLCQSHCLLSACHNDSSEKSCRAENPSDAHGNDHAPQPSHNDSSADSSCLTLKSALTSSGTTLLVIPQFLFLHAAAPATLALNATDIEPIANYTHNAGLRERVFTPEVYLGPAFRSHAPPLAA